MKKIILTIFVLTVLLSLASCVSHDRFDKFQEGEDNASDQSDKEYKNEFHENLDNAIILPNVKTFLEYKKSDFESNNFKLYSIGINMKGLDKLLPHSECTRVVVYPKSKSSLFSIYYGNNGYEFFRIEFSYSPIPYMEYEFSEIECESFDEILNAKGDHETFGIVLGHNRVRYNRDVKTGDFYAVSICEDISSYHFAIYLNTDVVNEHFDKASDKQKEFMSAIFPQFGATEESATRVTGKFEGIAPDPQE
ncbi:MAG: hypothetical protein IJZ03_03835 [Clostridia bacterium]|nr:hypothetical protein [Clostridia bacterium]